MFYMALFFLLLTLKFFKFDYIKGTKIYITHGDQDMSDNIIHLVLAKIPNSPPGVKGISLFLVPKYYNNDQGKLIKNDIKSPFD